MLAWVTVKNTKKLSSNTELKLILFSLLFLIFVVLSIYGLLVPEFSFVTRRGHQFCFSGINKNILCIILLALSMLYLSLMVLLCVKNFFLKIVVDINSIHKKYASYLTLGVIVVIMINFIFAGLSC